MITTEQLQQRRHTLNLSRLNLQHQLQETQRQLYAVEGAMALVDELIKEVDAQAVENEANDGSSDE